MSITTIGADPEVFLRNKEGKLTAAPGLFPGRKNKAFNIGDGCGVQVDNVALEYNIPATLTQKQFVSSNLYALSQLTSMAKKHDLFLEYGISSASFPEEALEHPGCWVFGCAPDFNVWTQRVQTSPKHPDKNFRSIGGHIHVGFEDVPDREEIIVMARLLDIHYYLNFGNKMDQTDIARRELYGPWGSIRFKPYGFEYRTAGTEWMRSIDNMGLAYETVTEITQTRLEDPLETMMILEKQSEKVLELLNTPHSNKTVHELCRILQKVYK